MLSYYSLSDLDTVKVRLNILRLIDENNILKNQLNSYALNQIYFTLEITSHSMIQTPKKYSRIIPKKMLFDQSVLFDVYYSDLSVDSLIGISIWSSAKQYDQKRPLGSTVISVFDDKLLLRQGKYHLFVWPNTLPDFSVISSTNGLKDDPNIATLNFISDKLQQQGKLQLNTKSQQALKLKLFYTYRLIPAAFLEVQFPKFSCSVFFRDKICSDYQEINYVSLNANDFNDGVSIYDPDFQADRLDPLQQIFFLLKRQNEGNPQDLFPTHDELKLIQDIYNKRSFKFDLKSQQRQLFVRYRYYLSQQSKYLILFLHSVQWSNANQAAQGIKMLKKWSKIDKQDALHILSKQFSANPSYQKKSRDCAVMRLIRDYAVQILREQKNQNLVYMLLELVQSIRYDAIDDSSLVTMLTNKSLQYQQIAVLLYWYLKTQADQIVSKQTKIKQFNNLNSIIYKPILEKFMETLKNQKPQFMKTIKQQIKLLTQLRKISKAIKDSKDNLEKKKIQLRKKLQDIDWIQFGFVTYPMDINIKLKAPIPAECTIFGSKMSPLKLSFETMSNYKFSFIYKNGDDLRQDQLILDMFALMDRLLKGVNQDYKLTPYKALACSKTDGYVEFVPETQTIQDIKNMSEFLTKQMTMKAEMNTSIETTNTTRPKSEIIMENYIFSNAGYCAITYFFGIGDRHLENLLINNQGKLFHIDFGFILGRDPKPYPPPIKICKEMIDGMGGSEHQNFKKFKLKCLQAYLYLRKYSKLVYNLFYLMLDSGLKDVHQEGLSKLYDKFLITMNDKEAEKHFLMVLQECQNALFGNLAHKLHIWATYFR